MHIRGRRTYTLLLALSLWLSACGPTLAIRHMDPSIPQAKIWIDGELYGAIDYQDELSIGLERGPHTIKASTANGTDNPWRQGAPEWHFILDEDAVLSLLPTSSKER